MKIGAALVLLAVGAILRFAITTTATHGINVRTIGDILMIVGILGLVLSVLVWAPWGRSRRTAYSSRPTLDEEERVAPYRTDDGYGRYQDGRY
jgi:hypothetical protein